MQGLTDLSCLSLLYRQYSGLTPHNERDYQLNMGHLQRIAIEHWGRSASDALIVSIHDFSVVLGFGTIGFELQYIDAPSEYKRRQTELTFENLLASSGQQPDTILNFRR